MKIILFVSSNESQSDTKFLEAVFSKLRSHGYFPICIAPLQIKNCISLDTNFFWRYGVASDFLLTPEMCESATKGLQIYERSLPVGHLRQIAKGFAGIMAALQPAVLIVWNHIWPEHALAIDIANRLGVPTLIMERSPWPGLISLDEKGFLGAAAFAENIPALGCRDAPPHTLVTELFAAIEVGNLTWYETARTAAFFPSSDGRQDRKVVLFLEQVNADANASLWGRAYPDNMAALRDVAEVCANRPDIQLRVRRHPKAPLSQDAPLNTLPGNVVACKAQSLSEAIKSADVVVAVNSAGLYESIIHHKASICLGQTILDNCNIFFESARLGLSNALDRALEVGRAELDERRSMMLRIAGGLVGDNCLFPARSRWLNYGSTKCAERIIAAGRRDAGGSAMRRIIKFKLLIISNEIKHQVLSRARRLKWKRLSTQIFGRFVK